MNNTPLTAAERGFRIWMLISGIVYLIAIPIFLLGGHLIPPLLNLFSSLIFPSRPLYPLPAALTPEGAFWQILSVSMMAMLTWICFSVHADPRRHINMTPILLISKSCSSLCYLGFFLKYGYLAYLVGVLTDGPIFLVSWLLWYAARPGARMLDAREEAILLKIGDTFMPPGGDFPLGYRDLSEACLEDTRRMIRAMDPLHQIGVRLLIRLLNGMPILILFRPVSLRSASEAQRIHFFEKLDQSRNALKRMLAVFAKVLVFQPFFNQPEAAEAVGYIPSPLIEKEEAL